MISHNIILLLALLFSAGTQAQETLRASGKDTVIEGVSYHIDASDVVYGQTTRPPKFNESFMKFLQKNLRYPYEAQAAGIQGTVIIGFIVNKNGTIRDLAVADDSPQKDSFLVKEFMRILRLSSGKWQPGIQNGYVVNSRHKQPLNFMLAEEENNSPVNKPWPIPKPPGPGDTVLSIENGVEHVFVLPKFNGDIDEFVKENTDKTKKTKNECVVLVEFAVDENGQATKMRISPRSPCKDKKPAAEALRVIGLTSGLWSPAKRDGKPVTTFHQQHVIFSP